MTSPIQFVCVTDQDTLTYPNLCGFCKNLAPEILSWYRFRFVESLHLRRKTRTFGAHFSPLVNPRTFSTQAVALCSFVGLSHRIKSFTKTPFNWLIWPTHELWFCLPCFKRDTPTPSTLSISWQGVNSQNYPCRPSICWKKHSLKLQGPMWKNLRIYWLLLSPPCTKSIYILEGHERRDKINWAIEKFQNIVSWWQLTVLGCSLIFYKRRSNKKFLRPYQKQTRDILS